MKYLPFALALIATPAAAQSTICVGGGPDIVLATTGLGNGGYACQDAGWRNLTARVTIVTGSNPGPVATITIDTHQIETPQSPGSPHFTHAVCNAMAAWTMPWYAGGLPIPEWPLAFLDQSADDNGIIVPGSSNATIRVRFFDPLHGFEPDSNYSLNIKC